MSSNIKIQRICQHCGNEFTARTTTTLYCSHRFYTKQSGKVEQSNKVSKQGSNSRFQSWLSRQNVYNLINTGKLKATNILLKKTIVKRSDLDKLFKEPTNRTQPEGIPETQKQELNNWVQAGGFDIADCYNLTEVQDKYGISETALQNLIKRNSIPKIKKGWFAYVPKTVIDKLLS
jgi:hypothetical protein